MNTINNTEIGDDSDLDSEIDCDSDAGDTVEAGSDDIEAGSDDDGVVTVEDSVGLYDDTTTNITVADINDGSTNDAIMGVEFDGSRGVDEIDGSRGVDEIDGSRGVDDSGTDVELETQRSIDVQLLPTHTTKRSVYKNYVKVCATLTYKLASYRTFCRVWQKYKPSLIITTPKSDLCWTCQKNSFAITESANKSLAEKQEVSY